MKDIKSSISLPLLSIAIPTWNRAQLLARALACLRTQIIDFKNEVEIVISDNASTDNTQEVINNFIKSAEGINIISYKQNKNTGYYGNFKKVRELSNGKFFWILSDDDHVQDGLIKLIIENIKKNKDLGLIFLDVWDNKESNTKINLQKTESVYSLINRRGYRLTLISAIIFLNIKDKDEELFNTYNNNSFIGFLLFINTIKYLKDAICFKGPSLKVSLGIVSFNVYNSWIEDMKECLNFMEESKISKDIINSFVNSFLKNVLKTHYINSRLNHYQINDKNEIKSIEQRLRDNYSNFEEFDICIEKNIRRSNLFLYLYHRNLKKRIKNKFLYILGKTK